jgi:hypothetical protein
MPEAPITLWSQQEKTRPDTIIGSAYFALFFAGLFGTLPTILMGYVSFKGWNIAQDLPATTSEWFSLGGGLAFTIIALSSIWESGSGAAERLPARVCLFILGSLPSGFAERTARSILALSAALVVVVIIYFLLWLGPFVMALPRPHLATVSTSALVVYLVAPVTVGLPFVGLLWLSLCAVV